MGVLQLFVKKMKVEEKLKKLILSFLFLILLFTRLSYLNGNPMVDEPTWMHRSENFVRALLTLDFKQTYQSAHPGIATLYFAGISNFIFFKAPQKIGLLSSTDKIFISQLQLISFRIGLVFINMLLVALIYLTIKHRIKKPFWAISTLLFLTFEPFIIRFSKITHVDAVFSLSTFLALLFFYIFLQTRNKRDFLTSCFFSALSFFTKTPSLVIVPLIIVGVFFSLRTSLRKKINLILMYLAITFLIGYIAWPVLWSNPLYAVKDILLRNLTAILRPHGVSLTQKADFSPDHFFYARTLWNFITPQLLTFSFLGIILGIHALIKKRGWSLQIAFSAFVVTFILFMSFGGKKGERYILPTVVSMTILGGWSLQKIYTFSKKIAYVLLLILGSVYVVNTISLHPFYFIYYNPWVNIKDPKVYSRIGLGEGLELAAKYLNQKKSAEKLVVASWYDSSFAIYFKGKTIDIRRLNNSSVDYAVVYGNMYGRKKLSPASKVIEKFKNKKLEKIIKIKGVPYVFIYKLK